MPRNGSGTMSVSNSFSSGTTISSSEMNANFTDFASEVTNSLPRDGQAAMTGQLKITAGTAAAPGLIFSTDTDTGIYRVGADTVGIAVGGAIAAQINSTGVQNASGEQYDAFAAGTSMLFYQATAPTGWTAEAINDKALRVVASGATGGTDGGTTSWSNVMVARTITQANLPNVNLTAASDGAHQHFVNNVDSSTTATSSSNYIAATANFGNNSSYLLSASATVADRGLTSSNGAHTHTVPLGGSGTALDFAVQYSDVIIATKD